MMAAEEDLTHFSLCPQEWGGANPEPAPAPVSFQIPNNPDQTASFTCTGADMRQKLNTRKIGIQKTFLKCIKYAERFLINQNVLKTNFSKTKTKIFQEKFRISR